jgi:uncharacterized protein YjeT (DUF2065 family)
MRKTWLSLHYLAGYLSVGGLAFLLTPQTAAALFQSNGTYNDLMLRLVGLMMLGLAVFVIRIIVTRATEFYRTTLLVRAGFLAGLAVFYVLYEDPMLLVLLAIVGLGFVLTLSSYLLDGRAAEARSSG